MHISKGAFMPAQIQFNPKMSGSEYFAFEENSIVKHEFAAWQVVAMAGASARHDRIAMNVAGHLHQASRRSECTTFMSDMRVKIDHFPLHQSLRAPILAVWRGRIPQG